MNEENRLYEATLRIPTEQYAFIEIKVHDTPEGIQEAMRAFKRLATVQSGIDAKEYDKFIERQLLGETNVLEQYNAMSEDQQRTVQIIKRALLRIKRRETKEPESEFKSD